MIRSCVQDAPQTVMVHVAGRTKLSVTPTLTVRAATVSLPTQTA